MIRQLSEADREQVLAYLYKEPNFNIFPIGDIETFGFDRPFQRVYGEFDDKNRYLSVFLRYRDNAIYYADTPRFNPEYLKVFANDPFRHLSGKTELIRLISPHMIDMTCRTMYFCKADRLKVPQIETDLDIRIAQTQEDCEKQYDLLSTIEEFGIRKQEKSDYVEGKMQSMHMGVSLYIESEGKMVASVSTTAETSKNAMVVGVATDKEHRNKGYASLLMMALMIHYFDEKHKELCLFYDNPNAGKIYLRLGFEYLGQWEMCEVETPESNT